MFPVKIVDFLDPDTGTQCWFATSYHHNVVRIFSGISGDGDIDICVLPDTARLVADRLESFAGAVDGPRGGEPSCQGVPFCDLDGAPAGLVIVSSWGNALRLEFEETWDGVEQSDWALDITMERVAARESVDSLRKAIGAAVSAADPVADAVSRLPARLKPLQWTAIGEPLWPRTAAIEVVQAFAAARLAVWRVQSRFQGTVGWYSETRSDYRIASSEDWISYAARCAEMAEEWLRGAPGAPGEMISLIWRREQEIDERVHVRAGVPERIR